MSIDKLHEKIRKLKSPVMVDFGVDAGCIPQNILEEEGSLLPAWVRLCREIMDKLEGSIPAVRFPFDGFALYGPEGLNALSALLSEAQNRGYYVLLDGPAVLSPWAAERAAQRIFDGGEYPCDALLISPYIGSDAVKPFLPYCKSGEKALFLAVRTPNKTALELQDLLTGTRLVHGAAAELVNRHGEGMYGKCGYSRIAAAASAGNPNSLRALRTAHNRMFLLVDGLDYPSGNAKNCSFAFDQFGYGAVVSVGPEIVAAWKASEGIAPAEAAVQAAERIKKNLLRYVTIL